MRFSYFENLLNRKKSTSKFSKHSFLKIEDFRDAVDFSTGEKGTATARAGICSIDHKPAHNKIMSSNEIVVFKSEFIFGNLCANSCTRTNVTIHYTQHNTHHLQLEAHCPEYCPWPPQESGNQLLFVPYNNTYS